MTLEAMQQISGHTLVVPILAHPVAHVQTPRVMNQLLARAAVDAVCIPLNVRPEHLAQTLQVLRSLPNVPGVIVTVPHKIEACRLCSEVGDQAQVMGAVNAIRFSGEGALGEMYDGRGFVQGVRNSGVQVAGTLPVYLAGAGGAARGVAFALLEAGVRSLQIYNRTESSALALIDALRAFAPDAQISLAGSRPQQVGLAINATAAGMYQDLSLPFEIEDLGAEAVVAEVVMDPPLTPLLRKAQGQGLKVVKGEQMLFAQVAQLAAHVLGLPALAKLRVDSEAAA